MWSRLKNETVKKCVLTLTVSPGALKVPSWEGERCVIRQTLVNTNRTKEGVSDLESNTSVRLINFSEKIRDIHLRFENTADVVSYT